MVQWQLQQLETGGHMLEEGTVEPVVNFGTRNGSTILPYTSDHFREDGAHLPDDPGGGVTAVQIPVLLDIPAPVGGTVVPFTIGGTAVAGTHYALLTPSPITINKDKVNGTINLDLPGDTSTWYDERSIIITLDTPTRGTLGTVSTEYRVWVRPVDSPREVQWSSSGRTDGAGSYAVHAETLGGLVSQDPIKVYYSVNTTLIEGTDYTLSPASGAVIIAAGDDKTDDPSSTRLTLTLTADGALKSLETLALTLEHEPSDRSQENWWTTTASWKGELYKPDRRFPGEPSTHGFAGGDWPDKQEPYPSANPVVVIGQDEDAHPDTGQPFWGGLIDPANYKKTPDLRVMQAVLQHSYLGVDGNPKGSNHYIRESFEMETFCGGSPRSAPKGKYTLVSVYVDTIPTPQAQRNSLFVKVTLRDRVKDLQTEAVWYRASSGVDNDGNDTTIWSGGSSFTGSAVTTDTGDWGVWFTKNNHASDKIGVEEEAIVGEDGVSRNYTRLWFRHFIPDGGAGGLINEKGDTVTEEQGDVANVILRFTHASGADGSNQIQGGPSGWAGKGLLAWNPLYVQSASEILNSDVPPSYDGSTAVNSGGTGRPWDRAGHWQRPRGLAYISTTGQNTYTFTVA